MKKLKKINPKDIQKSEVMAVVSKALAEGGFEVLSGEDFGMTKGTLVVRGETCDVQLKPITPKAGVERYESLEEEE